MSRKDLDKLRRKIRRVDDQILKLARERTGLAKQIGEWKLENSIPVRDFETERDVLAIAEERCREFGLDPTVGREITRALIGGAVKIQEELRERKFGGTQKRITIIGGKGKMGEWLSRYLHSRGHQVTIFDKAGGLKGFRRTLSLERGVKGADIIVLSVPLHAAASVYRKVRKLRPKGTVVDQFSLKTPVIDEIRLAIDDGISVSSIHPLFGPDVYLLSDRILLLCSCGHQTADKAISELFSGTSLERVDLPVEEHDKAMGIVLGLSHAVSIIFTEALARSGLSSADLRKLATTTYLKQAGTASEVAMENPRLYYDIQSLNRYTPEVHDLFQKSLDAFRKSSLSRNPTSFLSMMKRGRAFFESEKQKEPGRG